MRWTLTLMVTVAVVLAGCAAARPPAPVATPTTSTTPVAPPTDAPQGPRTVNEWNDESFSLIQQKQWQQAEAAARKALALDQGSAAGWFNLGRALLGQHKASDALSAFQRASNLRQSKNADVQYFLGQAYEETHQDVWAHTTYELAMKQWPDDPRFRDAMAALMQRLDPPVRMAVDIDGDGRNDEVRLERGRLQIISADGKSLYDHTFLDEPWVHTLMRVDAMTDKTALVQVQIPTCAPDGADYLFLWYDTATRAMASYDPHLACGFIDYKGDGKFALRRQHDPLVRKAHWSGTELVTDPGCDELNLRYVGANLDQVFTAIADPQNHIANAEKIFVSPELLQSFLSQVRTGRWVFHALPPEPGRAPSYLAEVDGRSKGTVDVDIRYPGQLMVIHGLVWRLNQ